MNKRFLIAAAVVAALAGCGGTAAPHPHTPVHRAAAGITVNTACRYLDNWQASHGLNDNPVGREALAYVALHAHNRIGSDAARMLADFNAGLYTSPNSADPDEARWVNDCMLLTGTP
jgi:hypothetical protein